MYSFLPRTLKALCLAAGTLVFSMPQAKAAVRIMPLGDSITYGMGAGAAMIPGGYRDPLAQKYATDGTAVTFVGSDANNTTAYLLANDEANNEGHTGYRTDQIQTDIIGWQTAANPDVILLHIGTNDILQLFSVGTGGNDTSAAIYRLKTLLTTIYATKGSVKVVLSTLIPIMDTDPAGNADSRGAGRDAYVKNYNGQLASVVIPFFQAQGRNITLVDNYANFVNSDGTWKKTLYADYAHPNASGYALMAATYAAVPVPNFPGVIATKSSAAGATGLNSPAITSTNNLLRSSSTLSSVSATAAGGFSLAGLNDGAGSTTGTGDTYYTLANFPATITFNLNTATNPNGYDITSLQSITGWGDHNLGEQRFQLLLSVNGGPYADYGTFTNSSVVNGGNSSFLTTLTHSSGVFAKNVTGIRFVFLNPDPSGGGSTLGSSQVNSLGGTVIQELQAFGTPSAAAAGFSPLLTTTATANTAAGEDGAIAANLIRTGQSTLANATVSAGNSPTTFPATGVNDGPVGANTYYTATDPTTGGVPGTATFELNTITNTAGYDISSIQAITGWTDHSLGAHRFKLLLSINHEEYADYGTYANNAVVNGGNSSYLTTVSRSSGLIATNVTGVRFVFLNPDPTNGNSAVGPLQSGSSGGTVVRELQAFGTPSTIVAPPTLIHTAASAALTTGEDSAIAVNLIRSGQSTLSSVVAPIPALGGQFPITGLNDGSAATAANETYYAVTDANNGSNRLPSVVTFNLNTATNHFGYDISSIQAISGWTDHSLGMLRFQLQLSRANGPYLDYGTYSNNALVNGGASSYLSTLTSASGTIATNVTGIRFIFLNPDSGNGAAAVGSNQAGGGSSGGTVIHELQAFGTPSTGSITFSDWAANTYGLSGANAKTGADPDGDGLTNLQEFAFGTNPTVSGTGPLAYSGTAITAHGLPTISVANIPNNVDFRTIFLRRKDYAAAGLTYTVQFSAGLDIWVDSTVTPTVLATDATMEAVSVPYPLFITTVRGSEKPTFSRVKVSSN